MWKQLKTWWRAEGDLAALHGLGDRLLEDMGLEREGLRDRVHGRSEPPQHARDCVRQPLRSPSVAK